MPSILSVSLALAASSQLLRVGGRVVGGSDRLVLLADAFDTVAIQCITPQQLTPGMLAVYQVSRNAAAPDAQQPTFIEATLLESFPGVESGAVAEFRRFTLGGVAANLRARANLEGICRKYFDEHSFVEVPTPVRVNAPGSDVHIEPLVTDRGWLITSPEFHMKRLLTGGLPRIYQFARCTRNDESGPWHESEFTLLEWYRAFDDVESVMTDTEQLLRRSVQELGAGKIYCAGQPQELPSTPFLRLTIREAFRQFAGHPDAVALAEQDEGAYFETWVNYVEPALAKLKEPVFLTEFPVPQAALARACPHDPSVAERFELVVGGVELCNGYGELCDAEVLASRFQKDEQRRRLSGSPIPPRDERLLCALREGMPPSGGNAMGIDRLLALCLGTNIQQVIAFPGEL